MFKSYVALVLVLLAGCSGPAIRIENNKPLEVYEEDYEYAIPLTPSGEFPLE